MWITLAALGLFTAWIAFLSYWKGYAQSQRQVRWLRQELLRAERIAEQMKDAAIDAELDSLLRTAK